MSSPNFTSTCNPRADLRSTRRSLPWLMAALLLIPAAAWADADATTAPHPPPLTLQECYALALKRSEEIAIHQEQIAETTGRLLQTVSGLLPRASFNLSEKRQDGSGGSAFTLKEVPERKFVFSQPLFSGFKEFAALAGSRAERRQRTHEKRRAEQLLFLDVTDAFYLRLEQEEDLQALAATHDALTERLKELADRQRLGRSRVSEVASATAQLKRLEAEVERVRSLETTAHQLLAFLTGLEHSGALEDAIPTLPSLDDEAQYAAMAGMRPDVQAAAEAWRVAERAVTVAKAKFWPTVDLEGNYYEKRAGAASGVDWDMTLKVDAPIFQGGQVVGSVKEAAARAREAQLQFARTQRLAELDIRETHAKLRADTARTAALQKALEASVENYRLQAEDYKLSLVSNLEVLQALQALQDARREFLHAQYETKRLYWQLQVATGQTL